MSDATWLTIVVSAATSGVVSIGVQSFSKYQDRKRERRAIRRGRIPEFELRSGGVIQLAQSQKPFSLHPGHPLNLKNIGTSTATNVRVSLSVLDEEGQIVYVSLGGAPTLTVGEVYQFSIHSKPHGPLFVFCDQRSDPVEFLGWPAS
jgi:hypothetical protein